MKEELAPTVSPGMIAAIDEAELVVVCVTEEGVVLKGSDEVELPAMEPNAFLAACTELKLANGMSVREVARGSFIPGFDGLSPAEQRRARDFEPHVRWVMFGSTAMPWESDFKLDPVAASTEEIEARLVAKLNELEGGEFGYARTTFEDYMRAYRRCGVVGLARRGPVGRPSATHELVLEAMEEHVSEQLRRRGAKVQKRKWLDEIEELVKTDERFVGVQLPSRSTMYRELAALLDRLGVTGTRRKYQQSATNGPKPTFRKPAAVMSGDRVEIDSTTVNNMVTDGFGNQFRAELVAAIDTATRTVVALVVARSIGQPEVAALFLEMMAPKPAARPFSREAHYNRLGIDAGYLARYLPEAPEGASEAGVMVVPRVITIDRGKAFDNKWLLALGGNLGFEIEFARPYTPTDKPHIERFFATLETVLERLPGYVGTDTRDRGLDPKFDPGELFTMAELETALKAWVTRVYHHTPHTGLIVPDARS